MSDPSRPHVAASDCECIHDGLLAQPANALSSLAFIAVAVPIARSADRRAQPAWRAVALASAFEGLGSAAYHGPGGRWSKVLHDAGLVALSATIGVALSREPPPIAKRPVTAGLAASAIALHALSRTGRPLCAAGSRVQGHAVFHLLAAGALAAAAAQR